VLNILSFSFDSPSYWVGILKKKLMEKTVKWVDLDEDYERNSVMGFLVTQNGRMGLIN
jgi:hypothetical protein